MIRYLEREHINVAKYDACIASAKNSRIYAYSWYLDCVADNWGILVFDDYIAVMPLPWKSKFFIKYIYIPIWTQQLGTFSSKEITATATKLFIKAIPKKYRKITYQFNSENKIENSFKRINYIFNLKANHKIEKQYRNDRIQRLKQARKYNLVINECDIKQLIEISKKNYNHLKIRDTNYNKLIQLYEFSKNENYCFTLGVYDSSNEFLGGAFFLMDTKRITYLFSVLNEKGKNLQAGTFLINHIQNKFSGTNYILDFEGSMIKGVADFYKSFGAVKEEYAIIRNSSYGF